MNITSWFKRVAQKYPAPGRYNSEKNKMEFWSGDHETKMKNKMQYWGMEPSNPARSWAYGLGQHFNLSRFNPQDVQMVIDHFAQKYYPIVRDDIIKNCDPCEFYEDLLGYDAGNLYTEIEETVRNMLRRAEVVDDEFQQSLYNFIEKEVANRLAKMAHKDMMNMPMYVRVYGTSQAFGGHEEGGWWYTDKKMVDQHQVSGLTEACKLASKLRMQMLKQKYEFARNSFADRVRHNKERMAEFPTLDQYLNDSKIRKHIDKRYASDIFYSDLMAGSGGARDLYDEHSSAAEGMGDLSYNDTEGMDYPKGWTTSAFENYFVTVETTPEPKEETRERPHYE